MSVWMRRVIVAVTVVALAPTPAFAAMNASVQVPAGSAAPPTAVTVEQTGPHEVTVTNTGATPMTFGGTALRGVSRLLKLDPSSTCLSARTLGAGASCVLRQRTARAATVTGVALRVTVAGGTVSLTNAGAKDLRLGGAAASSFLRQLGVRGGTCVGAGTLPAGGTCTVAGRPGAPRPTTALAAGAALDRGTKQRLTAFALTPTEQKLRDDSILVGATLVLIALLPVIVPAVIVFGPPLLLGAAVVSFVSTWLFLLCGSAGRCD